MTSSICGWTVISTAVAAQSAESVRKPSWGGQSAELGWAVDDDDVVSTFDIGEAFSDPRKEHRAIRTLSQRLRCCMLLEFHEFEITRYAMKAGRIRLTDDFGDVTTAFVVADGPINGFPVANI